MLYFIRFTKEAGDWQCNFAGYTFLNPHTEYAYCRRSYSYNYEKGYAYKRGIYYTWIGPDKGIPYPLE